MAKISADKMRVYFAGFDFGTATTSASVELAVAALDPTTIADSAERAIAGIRADAVEWAGLYDDSTLSPDVAGSLVIGSNTNNVISVHIGTSISGVAFAGTVVMLAAKAGGGVKDLVYQEAMLQPDGTLEKGFTQIIRTAFTGSGSSAFLETGGSSVNGGRWYLQVFSYTGGGSATITLQHGSSTAAGSLVTAGTVIISTRNSFISALTSTLRQFTRIIKDATGTAEVAVILVRS